MSESAADKGGKSAALTLIVLAAALAAMFKMGKQTDAEKSKKKGRKGEIKRKGKRLYCFLDLNLRFSSEGIKKISPPLSCLLSRSQGRGKLRFFSLAPALFQPSKPLKMVDLRQESECGFEGLANHARPKSLGN